MKREIKFRAWNTDIDKMIYLENSGLQFYDFEGSYSLGFTVDGYTEFWAHEQYETATQKANEFPIMQYTGHKDRKGREIYEFDVIIHNDNQYVIRYSDNLGIIALATTKEYSSFEGTVKRNHRYRDQAWLYNVQKYLSVIGNVFENPELLENKL